MKKENIFEKFTSSIVFAHLQCKLVHRYPVSHNAQNRHFTQYISDNFCFLLSIYNKFQLINSKFYASILFVYLSEFVSKRVIGNIMSIMQPNSHIMTKSIKTTNQLKMQKIARLIHKKNCQKFITKKCPNLKISFSFYRFFLCFYFTCIQDSQLHIVSPLTQVLVF